MSENPGYVSLQPLIDDGDGGGVPAPPKRTPLRQWRKSRYRFRQQLPPWRMLWLLPLAIGAHTTIWPPMLFKLAAVLIVAGCASVVVTKKNRKAPAEVRLYGNVCLAAVTLWSLFAVRCGLWGQPGRYSLLLWVIGWLPLSYLWWDKHRTRAHVHTQTTDDMDFDLADPFAAEWQAKVEPTTRWTLSDPFEVAAGTAYTLRLIPGQTIEDAHEARRKIASWLGGIDRNRLLFEPGDVEDEATIQLIVLRKDNPQLQIHEWEGPSLDTTTGLYKHGVYPDGPAFLRLFQVEGGVPHRARNGLWVGATGKGKSRGIAIKIAEQVRSGMFVTWYADGQNGVSAPELEDHVDWYAESLPETVKMLRAAWKVMKARNKMMKAIEQAAFRGQQAIYLGSLAFPFLQLILDEAQEFLTDRIVAKLIKLLLRMGNKVGIGVDLITQVPLLSELGSASGDGGAEVIRSMAKAGNVVIYKPEDSFTGTVTLGEGSPFNPKTLPDLPGACGINDGLSRSAFCRTLYVSKKALWGWLDGVPVRQLDETSARAAGEDYAARDERAAEGNVPAEELDLEDLESELAILLGEQVPGMDMPGGAEKALTIKQAVFEAVRDNGGPMQRQELEGALATKGLSPSKSSVDQAIAFWTRNGHMERTGHGMYDLLNREARETVPAS